MPGMIDDEEAIAYMCYYEVKNFIIMYEDQKLELDYSNILSVEYVNDYDYNMFAVLKVQLRIDIRKKLWILQHKMDIKAKFELDRVGVDTDQMEYVTSVEEVFNKEFTIQFNDDDDATDITMLEERLDVNDEETTVDEIESENYFESQNLMDIYLFHPDLLSASRTMHNRVYTSDTLQNITAHILHDSGHKDVLMSKFDNDEVYDELLLPPNHARHNLVYLDQYFGMYEKGALIFYDVDKMYILKTDGKVTAKEEEEWTECVILISSVENGLPGNAMIEVPDHEIYYVQLSEENIASQRPSTASNVTKGSACTLVNTDGTEILTTEADQSYIDERNENLTFIESTNKYTETVLKARLEENECVMFIDGVNLDMNAFKPNKEYKIVYQDESKQQKYGSMKFRLSYAYHYMKLESEHYMVSAHQFILKRTEGGDVS